MAFGDVVNQGPRAIGCREARVLLPEILHQERNPGEGARQTRVDRPSIRDLGQRGDNRVDRRVDRVAALPRQGEQLDGGHVLLGHQTGQSRRVKGEVVAQVHSRSLGGPIPLRLTAENELRVRPPITRGVQHSDGFRW